MTKGKNRRAPRKSKRGTVYPKRIGKSRLKSNIPIGSVMNTSYTIERLSCVFDKTVDFDFSRVDQLVPFTFQFGMYTAYPLYSADGAAPAVFQCFDALQRWTQLQIKSISLQVTYSRPNGSCIGVNRKGATDITNFDLRTDVQPGLYQASFAQGKPYLLPASLAYDPKGWIRADNPAQNVYFQTAANGSDALLLNCQIPHPGYAVVFNGQGLITGYQAVHENGLISITINFEVWCRNPRTRALQCNRVNLSSKTIQEQAPLTLVTQDIRKLNIRK